MSSAVDPSDLAQLNLVADDIIRLFSVMSPIDIARHILTDLRDHNVSATPELKDAEHKGADLVVSFLANLPGYGHVANECRVWVHKHYPAINPTPVPVRPLN